MIILKATENQCFTEIDPPPSTDFFRAFIESQFRCFFLTWMFHSRSYNNKINQLHEKVLTIVNWD